MDSTTYHNYIAILEEELVVALGCTEPIAIAYAAAKARETLGAFPDSVEISCSGNIIKNAMGVVVPNAGGLKGIQASVIAGLIGGVSERELEVLSAMTPSDIEQVKHYVDEGLCTVNQLESDASLHIIVKVYANDESATTEIKYSHLNVYRISKNNEIVFESIVDKDKYLGTMTNRGILSVEGILDFVDQLDTSDIRNLITTQIEYNMAIAEEGISGQFGVEIGKTILSNMPDNIWTKLKAYGAAASEARMSGSIMPVVTNSGSGNQGITCSVPVIMYAHEIKASEDNLIRALALSNLLAIHQKSAIGRLSAFCGAVSASCAAGAALTFLDGGTRQEITHTIVNTLANVSGIVCDGAKASCAAKIASSIDAATMAHLISKKGAAYEAGDGIIKDDIEQTIAMVGSMASKGMASTDIEILRIMLAP